jgi:putative phage-type endonuclease
MQTNAQINEKALVQGTEEWLQTRRWKITATDAPTIMGQNPWRTTEQLFFDKLHDNRYRETEDIIRGKELEEPARQLYILKKGIHVEPAVMFSNKNEWQMASLDGIDVTKSHIVEIKCPRKASKSKGIPSYYYAQLQHQMEVTGLNEMDFFTFVDFDGEIVHIKRDDLFIKKMNELEFEFYQNLIRQKERLGIV